VTTIASAEAAAAFDGVNLLVDYLARVARRAIVT